MVPLTEMKKFVSTLKIFLTNNSSVKIYPIYLAENFPKQRTFLRVKCSDEEVFGEVFPDEQFFPRKNSLNSPNAKSFPAKNSAIPGKFLYIEEFGINIKVSNELFLKAIYIQPQLTDYYVYMRCDILHEIHMTRNRSCSSLRTHRLVY
jgi:hypothetical protein